MSHARNTVQLIGTIPPFEKGINFKAGEGEKKAYYQGYISVRRSYKAKDAEQYEYDTLPIKAFGSVATYLGTYANKKDLIAVSGELQMNANYEKEDGTIVYGTPVVIVTTATILQSNGEAESDTAEEPNKDTMKRSANVFSRNPFKTK